MLLKFRLPFHIFVAVSIAIEFYFCNLPFDLRDSLPCFDLRSSSLGIWHGHGFQHDAAVCATHPAWTFHLGSARRHFHWRIGQYCGSGTTTLWGWLPTTDWPGGHVLHRAGFFSVFGLFHWRGALQFPNNLSIRIQLLDCASFNILYSGSTNLWGRLPASTDWPGGPGNADIAFI